MTWSRYKHHNTLKFLFGVAPNSYIVFISEAYTGCISDKEITNRTVYLDMLPPYCTLICDKGFLIEDMNVLQEEAPHTSHLVNGECDKWEVLMCQR